MQKQKRMIHKLDITETTHKNITCKNNCLINIVLLITMCLILLAIVFIKCCSYYTRY